VSGVDITHITYSLIVDFCRHRYLAFVHVCSNLLAMRLLESR
jgi:hypothetical protein